jgi:hypothetical protein
MEDRSQSSLEALRAFVFSRNFSFVFYSVCIYGGALQLAGVL